MLSYCVVGSSQTFTCNTIQANSAEFQFPGFPFPQINPPIVNNTCNQQPLFNYVIRLDLGQQQMNVSDPLSLQFRVTHSAGSAFQPLLNNITLQGDLGSPVLTSRIESQNVTLITVSNIVIPAFVNPIIEISLPFLAISQPQTVSIGAGTRVFFLENGTFVDCKLIASPPIPASYFQIFDQIQGLWSNLLGGINTGVNTPSEVVGDLIMDLPNEELGVTCSTYAINGPSAPGSRNCLLFQNNTSITVLAGNTLNICDLDLKSCGAPFSGITVQSGATLAMRSCRVFDAQTAILLEDGANLELFDTEFIGCNTAVRSLGQANITEFSMNFFDGGIGVDLSNSANTNLNAGSFAAANTFVDCTEGIKMQSSSADIIFNRFLNCDYGIVARGSNGRSQVFNNIIGYHETGIYCDGTEMNIGSGSASNPASNDIGYSAQGRGHTGVYAISSLVDVANNLIGAKSFGVRMELNFANDNIDITDNVIEVTGDENENFGIYTFWNSGIRINNNSINGDDLKGAIVSTNSPDLVTNNSVLSECENGIAMLGNVRDALIEQNLIQSNPDNGIFVQNAMGNEIDDNEIHANSIGLWVRQNSDIQTITCNRFEDGNTDVRSQSTLGRQVNANNEFREEGSFAEQAGNVLIEGSRFIIDENAPNLNKLKPEDFTPGNGDCNDPFAFFDCQSNSGGNSVCSGTAGFNGLIPDPDFPCWLADQVRSLKTADPQTYWIRYRQLLKRYVRADGTTDYPCILCYCGPTPDPEDCGLEQFVSMELELEEAYNSVEEAGSRINKVAAVQAVALSQLNQFVGEDATMTCETATYTIYSDMYQMKLKKVLNQDLATSDIDVIRSTSELCPDIYGEVVHWARGLRASLEEVSYNDLGCDGWDSAGQRQREVSENSFESELKITPNPVMDLMTLSNPTLDKVSYRVININGAFISEGIIDSGETTTMDVTSWESGLYLFEQLDVNGLNLRIRKICKK